MDSCTACGITSQNVLQVFLNENAGRKLPFCSDCVSIGAYELPFVPDRSLSPRQVLQRVVRVNRAALNEVRAARADVSNLESRIKALEEALTLEI